MIFQVKSYKELSPDILQVFLKQPEKPFEYQAGQYVEFLLPNELPRPFSIANPLNSEVIEFHIRHAENNVYAQKLVNYIKTNKNLDIAGPYGKMRYHYNPLLPLLFVAAGTGFAPCKALIEEALRDKHHAPIYLYWVARKPEDLYWPDTKLLHYTPIISRERVYDTILKDHPDLSAFHIYASGPQEMILEAQKKFNYPKYFYSDWLEFLTPL